MEQISKTREGNKEKRKHAKVNRTPGQRLLDSGKISEEQRAWIEKQLSETNPFEMKKEIEEELQELWELATRLDMAEARKWESGPSSARETQKNQAAIVSS